MTPNQKLSLILAALNVASALAIFGTSALFIVCFDVSPWSLLIALGIYLLVYQHTERDAHD